MIRLLHVEDCPADQELVRRGFRDPHIFPDAVEITVADTVDEALTLLERDAFDVILTDYSLPKRTGLELLHELGALGNRTPVIMLTGSSDTAIAVTALQDGATDFVIKDIAYERALAVVVRRALDKHAITSARDGAPDRAQQLERQLDLQARELRRALQESEALRRIAQLLSSTPKLADALDLVSRTAAQLLRAQAAAILLRHGGEYVLVNTWGALQQSRGVKHTDLSVLLAGDWIAVASAQLRDERDTIGSLWVGRVCHGPFVPHEFELLEALADLTALSIAKLRAREQLRRFRDGAGSATVEPPTSLEPIPAPAADVVPQASPAPAPVVSDASAALDATADATVLIVDDSEKVLLQARQALQGTMTVLTATSGKLAIEKYAATRPAAVVVDLVMPDMDGLATLAALQKLGCTASLALAVRGDVTARERARNAGYLGVVEKPFREGELAAQVAAILATAATDGVPPDHFSEEDGLPILTLPNPSVRTLAKILPIFDRHLRTLAEEGTARLIVDAGNLTQITPEHATMLARLFSEADMLGIEPVICTSDDRLVTKLRQIVELRDARYVPSRGAAKLAVQ